MSAAADDERPGEAARTAARAWMHAYGIHTGRYTAAGGDHPMMDTLPAAFEAFAGVAEREWLSQAEIGSLTRALEAEKAEVSRLLAQVATLTTALAATLNHQGSEL